MSASIILASGGSLAMEWYNTLIWKSQSPADSSQIWIQQYRYYMKQPAIHVSLAFDDYDDKACAH